uniref:Uncharacterized protein n=1 Tax=Arion vulgaris TaxID=1028688 RepID=A0A0B6XYR2_9EUPU
MVLHCVLCAQRYTPSGVPVCSVDPGVRQGHYGDNVTMVTAGRVIDPSTSVVDVK